MISLANRAFHEIDALIQESAVLSPVSKDGDSKISVAFAANKNEINWITKISPEHSRLSSTSVLHRNKLVEAEEDLSPGGIDK
jgi:hypothetical protein